MSELEVLTDKQLIDRHRHLADRVIDLKKKIEPLYDEYEKIRQEYIAVDTELATRQGLPTIESVTEDNGE